MILDPYLLPLAEASAAYTTGATPWFQSASGTCQVFFSVVDKHPTFAFGGTKTFREWLVDFWAPDVPFLQHPSVGPVHLGLWNDTQAAVEEIISKLVSLGSPQYLLCGHSKGGGNATLAAVALTLASHPPLAVRAYEPPCVGTNELSDFLSLDDIAWTKTKNYTGADIVTQVPDWPEWEHQGVLTTLTVPDAYGIAEKHEIPAVLAALQALA